MGASHSLCVFLLLDFLAAILGKLAELGKGFAARCAALRLFR